MPLQDWGYKPGPVEAAGDSWSFGGLLDGLIPSADAPSMAEHDEAGGTGSGNMNVATFSLSEGIGITTSGQRLLMVGALLAVGMMVLR